MFWKVRAMPMPVDLDGGLARGVLAVQQDGAPGGLVDLGEQVEHRGLASAVGADEAGDLSAAYGQVEVVHRPQAAEVDAQVAALQDGGLVDVPLGDDGVAGDGDHFGGLAPLLRAAHLAASFRLSLPFRGAASSSSPPRRNSRAKKLWRVGLLVASITRMSTMAYTSIR